MTKRIVLIFLLMLETILYATGQTHQTMNKPIESSKTFKMLSWNIYMLPYLSLFNNNGNRARNIADRLVDSDYNIIVFQEAFSSKCRNILAQRLKKNYPFQYGPANKCHLPFRTNSGLWVVSKIPLTKIDEIKFSSSKGFDMIARKGAVLFEGKFEGAKFQLLTTHLQADGDHKIREKQCKEINEHLLNQYSNPNIPQFICGDFNIDRNDPVNYELMLHTLGAHNGEISGDVKFTYDEIDNTLVRKASGDKKLIDYILVRNQQWIGNIERKVQTFYEKIGHTPANLSDHYAMEANVYFTEPGLENELLYSLND